MGILGDSVSERILRKEEKKLWDGEKLDSVSDIEMEESMHVIVGNVFDGMSGRGKGI